MPPKKAAAVLVAVRGPRFVTETSPDITAAEERLIGADPLIMVSSAKKSWKGVGWLVRVLPDVRDFQMVEVNGSIHGTASWHPLQHARETFRWSAALYDS
jgi:hypothetical protein